jgi:hypothetical protein
MLKVVEGTPRVNPKVTRVEISGDDGVTNIWTGEAAAKWAHAMNNALFMVQNHGMDPQIPKPTETHGKAT